MAESLYLQAMQTIVPAKATEPGLKLPIKISDQCTRKLFSDHLRIIFYFKQVWEDDNDGLIVGGWIKESLAMALPNRPVLAGRLDVEDHKTVKLNDAGVRLVYAQANTGFNQWLESVAMDKNVERQLSYWKDVDSDRPQNSPLCYVQMTNFQGEGFSIGISCSVLISDPLVLTDFIKTWSEIHRKHIAANKHPSKLPLFYRPSLRKAILPNSLNFAQDYSNETAVFKISDTIMKRFDKVLQNGSHADAIEVLGSLCYDKAKESFASGAKEVFTLVTSDKMGAKKVNMCRTSKGFTGSSKEYNDFYEGLRAINWDALSPFEVEFQASNKPVHVSYLIHPFNGEGLVIIMGNDIDDSSSPTFISVALPKLKT